MLATLAVGGARLAAEQTAVSESTLVRLAAYRVRNTGAVVAITRGEGEAKGSWVVVTIEQTIGTGPYAGLPPALHVAYARVGQLAGGWALSEWSPRS
jgi:hypothetical protein